MTTSPLHPYQARCLAIARVLRRQALAVFVLMIAIFCSVAFLLATPGGPTPLAAICLVLAAALAVAGVALSALLLFDARLFRLMATYPDERTGGAAVDTYLAERRLKPRPATVRSLAQRMTGARRWMRRQLMLAAATAILILLALAINFA